MFAARYYASRYFARRYFPSGLASILGTPKEVHPLYGPHEYTVLYGVASSESQVLYGDEARHQIIHG